MLTVFTRQKGTLQIKADAIDSLEERETYTILTTRVGNRYELDINEGSQVLKILHDYEGNVDSNGTYHRAVGISEDQQLRGHRRSDL